MPDALSTITCARRAARQGGRRAARGDSAESGEPGLGAIKSRNDLDTAQVDDVVLGVVDPVGEAAADIARTAALVAGYGDSVAGVQIIASAHPVSTR